MAHSACFCTFKNEKNPIICSTEKGSNRSTVDCSLKQPEQKIPRSFSLPACTYTVAIKGSKSVEKSILQQRPLGATS